SSRRALSSRPFGWRADGHLHAPITQRDLVPSPPVPRLPDCAGALAVRFPTVEVVPVSDSETMIENFLRRPQTVAEACADVVRGMGALSVIITAVWFDLTDAGVLALALPGLLIPRFLGVR